MLMAKAIENMKFSEMLIRYLELIAMRGQLRPNLSKADADSDVEIVEAMQILLDKMDSLVEGRSTYPCSDKEPKG